MVYSSRLKAREIIRIWTKSAWNYPLISLVTIWLHILTGIHRRKEDFPEKKKMFCITFSVIHIGVSMIITCVVITVKNRPRIRLVKFVVSITLSVTFSKKGKYFWSHYFGKSSFRGSLLLAFANTCEILSLLSEGCFFRGKGCR